MAPRVLVSDELSETAVQIFRDRGVDVDFQPKLGKDKDKLAEIIGNYDGLAIRSATKATAKIDFGRIFTTVLEGFYSYDGNQSRYEREGEDPETSNFKYVFGEFNQLGINATLQCRF